MRRTATALALLLALTACTKGKGIKGIKEFDYPTRPPHVKGHVDYAEHPPVGGPHSEYWLRCGVYDKPVPDENAVHALEHGAVWVAYRPDLGFQDVRALERLRILDPAYFLMSPYPGLADAAVATAWNVQLRVSSVTDQRLVDFVKKYAGNGRGGEPGADCAHGLTPDQIERAASATPTPPVSPS